MIDLTTTTFTQTFYFIPKDYNITACTVTDDISGNFFLMGLEHGADINGGTVVNGSGMAELSGYTLSFQGMEKKPANFLQGGVTGVGITVSASVISDI